MVLAKYLRVYNYSAIRIITIQGGMLWTHVRVDETGLQCSVFSGFETDSVSSLGMTIYITDLSQSTKKWEVCTAKRKLVDEVRGVL